MLTSYPGHFTPRKVTPYQLHRRPGKPQSQHGHFEDYLAPTRIQNPNRPAHSLVAVTKATTKPNRAKYGVTKTIYHLMVKAKPDDNIHADNTAKQNLMITLLQIILQVVNTVKMSGPSTPLALQYPFLHWKSQWILNKR